jgi:hypothetical protein
MILDLLDRFGLRVVTARNTSGDPLLCGVIAAI